VYDLLGCASRCTSCCSKIAVSRPVEVPMLSAIAALSLGPMSCSKAFKLKEGQKDREKKKP